MARPKLDIDFNKVDEYLVAQCSGAQIAGLIGVCAETLYDKIQERHKMGFSEYSAQKKAEGKEILRMKLWQIAMKGNVTMGIWLSKNYLGMTDKTDVDMTTNLSNLTNDQLIFITNELIKKQRENNDR